MEGTAYHAPSYGGGDRNNTTEEGYGSVVWIQVRAGALPPRYCGDGGDNACAQL